MTATTLDKPTLDRDAIAAEAAQAVTDELAGIRDDVDAAKKSAQIIADAEKVLAELVRHREDLILSLVFFDGHSALSVANAAGVGRSTLTKMMRKRIGRGQPYRMGNKTREELAQDAREARVRYYSRAEEDLADVSEKVIRAFARAEAAREVRDPAVRRLTEAGRTQAEVAELIGTKRAFVSHIVTGIRGSGKDTTSSE